MWRRIGALAKQGKTHCSPCRFHIHHDQRPIPLLLPWHRSRRRRGCGTAPAASCSPAAPAFTPWTTAGRPTRTPRSCAPASASATTGAGRVRGRGRGWAAHVPPNDRSHLLATCGAPRIFAEQFPRMQRRLHATGSYPGLYARPDLCLFYPIFIAQLASIAFLIAKHESPATAFA